MSTNSVSDFFALLDIRDLPRHLRDYQSRGVHRQEQRLRLVLGDQGPGGTIAARHFNRGGSTAHVSGWAGYQAPHGRCAEIVRPGGSSFTDRELLSQIFSKPVAALPCDLFANATAGHILLATLFVFVGVVWDKGILIQGPDCLSASSAWPS